MHFPSCVHRSRKVAMISSTICIEDTPGGKSSHFWPMKDSKTELEVMFVLLPLFFFLFLLLFLVPRIPLVLMILGMVDDSLYIVSMSIFLRTISSLTVLLFNWSVEEVSEGFGVNRSDESCRSPSVTPCSKDDGVDFMLFRSSIIARRDDLPRLLRTKRPVFCSADSFFDGALLLEGGFVFFLAILSQRWRCPRMRSLCEYALGSCFGRCLC
mmetsp:Transcript_10447/g.21996  ORF Transcript_10447/g.21996 Transcript_10447/m.21996 type:complete len:212 (+) Transcript_10447:348-983(+)